MFKNILKETNYNFKKNPKLVFFLIFSSSIMLYGIRVLQEIFIDNNIASIICTIAFVCLFCPILISIKFNSLKIVDGKESDKFSLYFGFHNFLSSLAFSSRTLMGTILVSIGGAAVGLIASAFGISIYLIMSNPELIAKAMEYATNIQALSEYMVGKVNIELIGYIAIMCITLFGLLAVSLFSLRKNMAGFILFETKFSDSSSEQLSINYYKEDKKLHRSINLFISLFIFVVAIILLGLDILLSKIITNTFIIAVIIDFIEMFSLITILVYYEILLATTYNILYRSKAKDANNKLLEKLEEIDK